MKVYAHPSERIPFISFCDSYGPYEPSGAELVVCRKPVSLYLSQLQNRCDRAQTIRSVLGSWGIQISTGGGTDFDTSTQSQFFRYVQSIMDGDASTSRHTYVVALSSKLSPFTTTILIPPTWDPLLTP